MKPRNGVPVYEIRAGALGRIAVRELWERRHLVALLAWRNIRVRYKQTILGVAWALLTPVAYTLIFLLFFNLAPIAPTGSLPLAPTIFAGMLLWQFFSRALADAGTSLSANANLITKVYFPRVVLPLSAILAALIDLAVSAVLLVLLLVWYRLVPGWAALTAPLWVLLAMALAFGCSLVLAALDGLYRDLRHAVPLLLQLGMFASPVGYTTVGLVPGNWRWLFELNPMVAPIEGLRWALIPDAPLPSAMLIGKSVGIALALLIVGAIFFSRTEQTVVDRV